MTILPSFSELSAILMPLTESVLAGLQIHQIDDLLIKIIHDSVDDSIPDNNWFAVYCYDQKEITINWPKVIWAKEYLEMSTAEFSNFIESLLSHEFVHHYQNKAKQYYECFMPQSPQEREAFNYQFSYELYRFNKILEASKRTIQTEFMQDCIECTNCKEIHTHNMTDWANYDKRYNIHQ